MDKTSPEAAPEAVAWLACTTGVHIMVRSGFREYEVTKLLSPACSRQENVIFLLLFTEPGAHHNVHPCTVCPCSGIKYPDLNSCIITCQVEITNCDLTESHGITVSNLNPIIDGKM